MKLKTYLSACTRQEKATLVEKLNTSLAYLSQLANGHRKAGASILLKIELATSGKVTPQDLRPDLYDTAA